ncbi:unannotated protein [freshwater metagenome]|uniref:Unannotated protein n=1 Tax=freshwater metagenome TaxID=449393 RepID=A0A6J7XXH0_9ZZZZ
MRAKGSNIVSVVRSAIASRNCEARSRPKVSNKIESGFTPALMRASAALISTVVFPVPGPPSTIKGVPTCVAAAN